MKAFDCEILASENTLKRNIAGFKATIVSREAGAVVVRIWNDFRSSWSEPQRVKPEEIKEL